jgi:hypothetical protein
VSAAIDGTIFVAIDENGSIGRDRNTAEKKPGKVVRMRDLPGTLYVMHPHRICGNLPSEQSAITRRRSVLSMRSR